MRILGMSGSLRAGSYNSGLLRAAQESAPAGVEVELYRVSPSSHRTTRMSRITSRRRR